MSDWDEVEGLVVGRHPQRGLDLLVVESTDGHGTQTQDNGFEQQVLGGVAGLQVDVARAALASILDRRTLVYSGDDKDGGCLANRILAQRGLVEGRPGVIAAQNQEPVTCRIIVVHASGGGDIDLKRIEGAGRGSGAIAPVVGYALGSPQELAQLDRRQGRVLELAD
jgi:hypothetical protein